MINDPEINAIYENRPTSDKIYASQLKKGVEQFAEIDLKTLDHYSDSKGNRNKSLIIEINCKKITVDDDKVFNKGKVRLIFPKISAAYMFANSNIDIRKDEKTYLITFKKESIKNYKIIKHEVQEDIF